MSTTTPAARSATGRGQRMLNLLVRAILRSPLHFVVSNRLLVITVIGRRTGARYVLPVGYVEHEGTLLIGTAGGWRRNLRGGETVAVLHRGRQRMARAEVVTDEATIVPLYRAILAHNPVHGRYAGIGTEPDGNPRLPELRAALRRGIAVVRLHPV